ncbi:MAG: LysR family transcriptional regulator [Lachnospiraceae bacterium]
MNTFYFKEFTTLAEVKNYWEASERLYINQSTLSKHIKLMESELGVPLFTRTTRRVELTKYGEAFLPYAQSIARMEFEYSTLLLQMQNVEKGAVTLGSIPSMAQYNITNILNSFQKEYPNTTVKIIEDDANNLMKLLYDKRCEVIFTRESKINFEKNFLNDNEVVRIPYVRDHMVVILPKNHPLAGEKEISLRSLQNENFCFIKEPSLMYDLCVDACQAANIIPKIAFTSYRLESIFDMVTMGPYVALLMNWHTAPPENAMFSPDVSWVSIDIAPRIYSQISLCYLKNQKLSKTAQNFVDFCQKLRFSREDNSKEVSDGLPCSFIQPK